MPALEEVPGFGPGIATEGATGLAAAGGAAAGFGGSDAKPLVCACAANATPANTLRLSRADFPRCAIDAPSSKRYAAPATVRPCWGMTQMKN